MYRSAAASRSRVVTPGRILVSMSRSVLTRIAPAAAMASISAGLFLMIMPGGPSPAAPYDLRFRRVNGPPPPPLQLVLEPERRDRRPDVIVDLRGGERAVEAAQQSLVVVVLHERRGRAVVDGEAVGGDVGLVVVAPGEGGGVGVAPARGPRAG